jgi:endo-1,4-beta-D-glucanase Y
MTIITRRRAFLAGAAALAAAPQARANTPWEAFKSRFVAPPGRVVDTGNGNVSHSESQGWGMLFAEEQGDRETFDRLWAWSVTTLRRRDGLFSWRYMPDRQVGVPDKNNATDGDLLMAWALMRAGSRWPTSVYTAESKRLRQAILDRLVIGSGNKRILLPGTEGFNRGPVQVVNLSYYVWPAFQDFARADGAAKGWRQIEEDGLAVLDAASFGAYRLPPDWLLHGHAPMAVADDWPPRFGFDAIRIPLYLVWGGQRQRTERFVTAWQATAKQGKPPAWIDLRSGGRSDYPASEGLIAIHTLCQAALENRMAPVPNLNDNDDYYSASLKMLVGMAAREMVSRELASSSEKTPG